MKMKQKLKPAVSLLLAFLLVLGLTPTSLFSIEKVYAIETPTGPTEGTCGNGLTWKLTAFRLTCGTLALPALRLY